MGYNLIGLHRHFISFYETPWEYTGTIVVVTKLFCAKMRRYSSFRESVVFISKEACSWVAWKILEQKHVCFVMISHDKNHLSTRISLPNCWTRIGILRISSNIRDPSGCIP